MKKEKNSPASVSGRERGKKILAFVLICFVCLLPLLIPPVISAVTVPCYDEIFDAELADKYDRLLSVDEKKIIVVGGSSVAFGLDSALLETYTGRPVINFGLYAAMGTKLMLDLSRQNVNEGDIVIIAPEMNEQTLSLYFNAKETLRALDSDWSMFRAIRSDNYGDLIAEWYGFASEKIGYLTSGTKPEVSGVYTKSAFNSLGDICYPRPQNIKKRGFDTANLISLSPEIFDAEFLDYLSDYCRFCKRRGAEVYFSYPPMNALAITPATAGEEAIAEFARFVSENVGCPVISDIHDYIMAPDLFFDTNFHLNDRGVPVRTARLALDLAAQGYALQVSPD